MSDTALPSEQLLRELAERGILRPDGQVTATRMTGGVSSDVVLIEAGDQKLVLKRSLETLRVRERWQADVRRNEIERRYIEYVAAFLPEHVPAILYHDPAAHLFVMAYVPPPLTTWKALLLSENVTADHARTAGEVLGEIHGHSWDEPRAREQFDTTDNFHQLRTDPYLLTTARRHPRLADRIREEADRLERTRQCLVHGDFSPKNLLVHPRPDAATSRPDGRTAFVILDCEVAWFGDPAFDLAFLGNHLLLKACHLPAARSALLAAARTVIDAYRNALGADRADAVVRRTAGLLPVLMLARVDGKSPVEYLADEAPRQHVRQFAASHIEARPSDLNALMDQWETSLG